ncbi:protein Mis18-beta [Narcine bancroftii]|uniref:protein Mis18-beta n=1 Tax=Narcine bancroftii TaxID=1343680 RepID=UPI0038313176
MSNQPAINMVSLKLPSFWTSQPRVWFQQVQAQFAIQNITADNTCFYYVVGALETYSIIQSEGPKSGLHRSRESCTCRVQIWIDYGVSTDHVDPLANAPNRPVHISSLPLANGLPGGELGNVALGLSCEGGFGGVGRAERLGTGVGGGSGRGREMDQVVSGSLKVKDCVIFQCKICHTVVGDSLQCCGSDMMLNVLMCLRLTEDVELDPTTLIGCEGPLSECLYKSLYCRFCRANVGFIPFSTKDLLSHLRGLYCLNKEMLHCYMLQSNSIVDASTLNLKPQHLTQQIGELKRQLVVAYYRLMAAMNTLEMLTGEESQLGISIINLEKSFK